MHHHAGGVGPVPGALCDPADGGLRGPRTILFRGEHMLVSAERSDAVLRFDAASGRMTITCDGKLAAARYCDEVRTGAFPTEEYAFGQVRRDESVMGAASGVSVSATALPSNPERTGAGYGPVS